MGYGNPDPIIDTTIMANSHLSPLLHELMPNSRDHISPRIRSNRVLKWLLIPQSLTLLRKIIMVIRHKARLQVSHDTYIRILYRVDLYPRKRSRSVSVPPTHLSTRDSVVISSVQCALGLRCADTR